MKHQKFINMPFLILSICTYCLLGDVSVTQALGKTYYISQSSGNDDWDGQAPSRDGAHGPWKTLAKASRKYRAGDSLLLKCGDAWLNDTLAPKDPVRQAIP